MKIKPILLSAFCAIAMAAGIGVNFGLNNLEIASAADVPSTAYKTWNLKGSTDGGDDSDWTFTNNSVSKGYQLLPSAAGKTATLSLNDDIFTGLVVTSDIKIELSVATYGSDTVPSASNTSVSAYGLEDNTTWTSTSFATGSTYPTSSTYTTCSFLLAKAETATAIQRFGISIAVNPRVRCLRLKTITIYAATETASVDPSLSITQGSSLTFMAGADNQTLNATTQNVTSPVYSWARTSGTSASIVSGSNTANLVYSIGEASDTPTVFTVTVGELSASISITVVAYGASSISWTSRPSSYNEGSTWSLGGTAVATMNDGTTKTLAEADVSLYVNQSDTPVSMPYTITKTDAKYGIGFGGKKSSDLAVTITPKATSLTIAPLIAVTAIQNDQTLPFTSSLTPSGAWDSTITWASSNTNVATISGTGLVTAVANGTTNITATTNNGLSSDAFALTVQNKVVYTVTQLATLVNDLANNGTRPGTYYTSGTISSITGTRNLYLGDGTSTIMLYDSTAWTSDYVEEGTLEVHGTLTKYTSSNTATNSSEISGVVVDSYEAPLPTSLTISGDAEFDIASSLTKTYTVTSSPTGSSSEVTWSIDSTTDNGAAITSGGVLTVTKDGTTTIKATSTADNTVSATKVINAYALASVVGTFKDSLKTTYYVSQSLESDLLTYAATYKCGDNAAYKTNVDVTSLVTTDYGIATSVYNNGAFVGTATSLAVTPSATLNSINASYSNTLTINVYNIVISSLSWNPKPTKTSYKFGEDLSIAGGVFTVVYEHSYPSSNVDVTADMVSGYNSKKLGKQTLTLTYEEHTLTYDVTVTNVGIVYSDSVSITGTSFGAYATTDHTATSTSGKTLNLVSNNVGCFSGNTIIQFRRNSGSDFYNSNSLGTITTIVLTGDAKSALTVYAGSTAHPTSSAVTGTNGSYTIGEEYFTIMNNTGSTAKIDSVAITIGSSISSSEQAASARDYLQQFRSCTGGWTNDSGVNSRAGVVQLIAEYNAMKDESKTAFASLALTVNDYDDKKSNEYSNGEYGTADPSVSGVNALVKLKRIVKEYNATKVSGETALSLSLPGGDTYSGSPASPFLFGDNNDTTTQIVIGSLSVVALGGVIVFARRKKEKNRA